MEVEDGGNTGWAAIATCHFTRVIFFFFCALRNDGSRDLNGWHLATNHLDMNYSPPNGNPYSSSPPKSSLVGMQMWIFPLSTSHMCGLIKTAAHLSEGPAPSALLLLLNSGCFAEGFLWSSFGIINDIVRSNIYEYGDQPRSAYAFPISRDWLKSLMSPLTDGATLLLELLFFNNAPPSFPLSVHLKTQDPPLSGGSEW